ncbi:MAG: hypothetical protein IT336_06265 [Thermomicrobiales bacterium]|nr:hypothetical protein [Thermomicrobiales bacterium]
MKSTFVVLSRAGVNRDLAKGSREQRFWDEHAAFIDALVEDGFILMGGPFDHGGAMLIVNAEREADVRATLGGDPWYRNGLLELVSVKRWEIFIDRRAASL